MTPRRVDLFWAGFFGLEVERLLEPGVTVVPHAALGDWQGAWVFWRAPAVVVSAPRSEVDRLRDFWPREAPKDPHEAALLEASFGSAIDRVIGPAWQGHLDPGDFRAVESPAVRALADEDVDAITALRAACTPREWDDAALRLDAPGAFGHFEAGRCLALASTSDWGEGARNPGVLCHPAGRGQGYGVGVLSAAVAHALAQGRLLLYQTMVGNQAAVAIALRLGYEPYATHVAVRLRS